LSANSPEVAENKKKGSINKAINNDTINDLLFSAKGITPNIMKVAKAVRKKLSLKVPKYCATYKGKYERLNIVFIRFFIV